MRGNRQAFWKQRHQGCHTNELQQILAFCSKVMAASKPATSDCCSSMLLYLLVYFFVFILQYPRNAADPCGYMRTDRLLHHNCQLCHLWSQWAQQRVQKAPAHRRHQRAILLDRELHLWHGSILESSVMHPPPRKIYLISRLFLKQWMNILFFCLVVAASFPHSSCIWSQSPWLSAWSQPSSFQHSRSGRIWVPSPCFWCSSGESFDVTALVNIFEPYNVLRLLQADWQCRFSELTAKVIGLFMRLCLCFIVQSQLSSEVLDRWRRAKQNKDVANRLLS